MHRVAHSLPSSPVLSLRLPLKPCYASEAHARCFPALHSTFKSPQAWGHRTHAKAQTGVLHTRHRLSSQGQVPAAASSLTAEAAAVGSQGNSSSSRGANEDHSAVQFEICRIPGDGSCLFRALAQGLHQLEAGALLTDKELLRAGYNLRREVCREMVLRRKEIEPFITGMFDAYVEAMALEGCWGGEATEARPIRLCLMETHAHAQMETRILSGEPELAIAIHCLQRPIVVYKQVRSTLFGKSLEKVSVYGAEEYPGSSPVCVLFSGSHYDTLVQTPVAT